jgi:putative ABC transport system permease protein
MDVDRVLLATVDSDSAGLAPARQAGIYEAALERAAALPGVERASLAAQVPFQSSFGAELSVPGKVLPELPDGGPYLNAVSEGFFQTLGTRLLQGRSFTGEDRAGAPPVVVINATFARLVWPGRVPLGQCVKLAKEAGAPYSTVIGVMEDARRSRLRESPTLQVYVPLAQAAPVQPPRALFVRFSGDPQILIERVRDAFPKNAASPVFVDVRPLADLLAPQLRPWRTGSTLFALFGLLALGLAGVGIHASLSQAVAQERWEIGIRGVLGAGRAGVLRLIGGQTLGIAAAGLILGWCLALLGARFIQPLFSGWRPGISRCSRRRRSSSSQWRFWRHSFQAVGSRYQVLPPC